LFCFEPWRKTVKGGGGPFRAGWPLQQRQNYDVSRHEGCSAFLPPPPLPPPPARPFIPLAAFARSQADRHGVSWLFSNFL